ncbi:tRNA (adenosine(37)-N6)-threonylcarbamoyltransferase complex ATPase subunit type 1 TsaE [Psittacicella hinzii]|uniref:tRNA threonylcarbamoyladenosine biosynthesis protein TsaE n=1 Tax=Psittacicella hinzii TaxID=2028575 RepID=A0A3A1Y4T1_9GAMM|nr:tRNA (adenosine(37)-N6)-threonylcarbamoyltransferase complex ATPase subunit type 1 TsaE [Psittacicella hinzii]RIY31167.1 tRNA (adenosine(37)-N6)-threonylcarbamoyltransferase complex ATPase subunit type 1 TsaE [Psittacicella hinzii]
MQDFKFFFRSQEESEKFAQELWQLASKFSQKKCFLIYLLGNLGAGKSTFSRAFIRAAGYQGNIPSPTYSIQEDYAVADYTIYHLDLYRLSDIYELDVLGFFDNQKANTVYLIEWPQLIMEDYPASLILNWQHVAEDANCRALEIKLGSNLSASERDALALDLAKLAEK